MAGLTRTPFDPVERIAEGHPCDILVVGSEDDTRALLVSCRQLGYAPHLTEDYDLTGSAYRRRHYNIMFIWMHEVVQVKPRPQAIREVILNALGALG